MTQDDKIQAFLDGEHVEGFEQELANDRAFKEKFENYKAAKELSRGLLEIDLQEIIDRESKARSKNWNVRWLLIPAAASVAILIFFLLPKMSETQSQYAFDYTEPTWPTVRGEADSLSMAISKYLSNSDYRLAKEQISEIQSLDQNVKDLWITEIFLKEALLDSAKVYLPDFSSEDFYYKRVERIRGWLAEN